MLLPRLPVLFLLVASAGRLFFRDARADVPPSNKVVFVLAGQSNMAGRGGVTGARWDGVVPPDSAPSPSVLRLTADLRWEEAREPLHQGIDVGGGGRARPLRRRGHADGGVGERVGALRRHGAARQGRRGDRGTDRGRALVPGGERHRAVG